jgi:hypothetical protein
MKPIFVIVLITIVVCIVLYTMMTYSFFNAPKPDPSPPPAKCPSGQKRLGNKCVSASGGSSGACPSGQKRQGNKCVPVSGGGGKCPSGQKRQGNKCVSTSGGGTAGAPSGTCPSGQKRQGNKCVSTSGGAGGAGGTCPSGQKRQGDKCVPVSGGDGDDKCPKGYTSIANGCKLQSPSGGYNPAPPVPVGTNPWDMAIAAGQQQQLQLQQSQGKPGSSGQAQPPVLCKTGFIVYNGGCIASPFKPTINTGLPTDGTNQNNPRPENGGGSNSSGGLGVNTTGCASGFVLQNGICVSKNIPGGSGGLGVNTGGNTGGGGGNTGGGGGNTGGGGGNTGGGGGNTGGGGGNTGGGGGGGRGGGQFSTGNGPAELGAALAVKLVQDAKAKGLTWNQVMNQYPALAQLPFPAIDNLHRDYIGEPTVDHDEYGMPIMNRSLFGGVI